MANILGTDGGDNLVGTNGADQIYGFGGADKLRGRAGDDWLSGGAGNDVLRGDAGADTMFGGSGNDTYYVDNAGDVVSEETVAGVDDGGTDHVNSSVSFTLGAFLENLTLTGSAAINATGNNLTNMLVGNSAANVLTGGLGQDTLTGGAGADTFMFGPADATSSDNVLDFTAEDRVGINAADYGLSLGNGLVLDGSGTLVLDPAYFATVSGSSTVQGTASGHGQFVFNTTTLKLMWDADGAGPSAGVTLAAFNSGTSLGAASFAITAPPVVGDISIGDMTISEGNSGTKTATFTVSRTGTAAFAVDFATADGTAAAGSDYVATAGTLSFAAGQATQTVSVKTVLAAPPVLFDRALLFEAAEDRSDGASRSTNVC
jgi:RTX calcium-binding nonapeptide repeat (4 copies)/Calx-beta domain